LATIKFGSGLKKLSGVFRNCRKLRDITFGDALESIDGDSFNGCSKLTTVKFGSGLKGLSPGAFRNCPKLMSLQFADGRPPLGRNGGHFVLPPLRV
jgi:hypothetical protein